MFAPSYICFLGMILVPAASDTEQMAHTEQMALALK